MKKINQAGRTMLEMLSVLGIIGVLSTGGLIGYMKAMHKYRVYKAVSYVTDAIVDYQLFMKREIGTYSAESNNMAETAQKFGLLPECQIQSSEIAGDSYQVCRFAIGEVYPRFFITNKSDGTYYTYMLYATFTRDRMQSCIDFLNYKWDQVVPNKYWRRGKLWLTSNFGSQVLYSSTVNNLNLSNITAMCTSICEERASYCSAVFDLTVLGY